MTAIPMLCRQTFAALIQLFELRGNINWDAGDSLHRRKGGEIGHLEGPGEGGLGVPVEGLAAGEALKTCHGLKVNHSVWNIAEKYQ